MRTAAKLVVSCVLFASTSACGGGGEATATERLWVSAVPTNPKMPITAFATTRHGDAYLGAFFSGTALRGSHDTFRWRPTGKARAELEFLQDGAKVDLQLDTCKPTTGFDHCLLVLGDPTGAVRYQSRKRWVVKRPGRRKSTAMVLDALSELATDDADVSLWLSTDEP